MKKVNTIAAALFAVGLTGCATNTAQQSVGATVVTNTAASATQAAQTQVLFVQSAERARVIPVSKQPGLYNITLYGVKPRVLWFNNQSSQPAGSYPLTQFLTDWTNPGPGSFSLNQPNAAFMTTHVEANDTGKDFAPVFTLANPSYNKRQNSMAYQGMLVQGSSKPQYIYYRDVALFIDGFCGAAC